MSFIRKDLRVGSQFFKLLKMTSIDHVYYFHFSQTISSKNVFEVVFTPLLLWQRPLVLPWASQLINLSPDHINLFFNINTSDSSATIGPKTEASRRKRPFPTVHLHMHVPQANEQAMLFYLHHTIIPKHLLCIWGVRVHDAFRRCKEAVVINLLHNHVTQASLAILDISTCLKTLLYENKLFAIYSSVLCSIDCYFFLMMLVFFCR